MVTLDLKDAYFHITIGLEHRKYLRFTLGEQHYQFKALPFGIASAPRVFTKTMAVIISHLHTLGVMIFPYLDDWLIVADSKATVSSNLEVTLSLLRSLGIQVNWKKSHLDPTRRIQFIGAILDSLAARAFLPLDRAQTLWRHVQRVRKRQRNTAYAIQQLLGHMAAAIAVVPLAKLHMRPIQLAFLKQFNPQKHSQSRIIFLNKGVRNSLLWWTLSCNVLQGTPFRRPIPTMTLTTDASLIGWGAHLGRLTTRGQWAEEDAKNHINWLELKTILLAIKAFIHILKNNAVVIRSDNITAVSYVNKQGGTVSRSLCRLAMQIWTLCIDYNINPVATHVPGIDNSVADSLSRTTSTIHKWTIRPEFIQPIFHLWGKPIVDVFATAQNTQCDLYCTRGGHDPHSLGDGLLLDWSTEYLYMFPPIPLISRVLRKIQDQHAQAILIAPWWPRQNWFPALMQMSN